MDIQKTLKIRPYETPEKFRKRLTNTHARNPALTPEVIDRLVEAEIVKRKALARERRLLGRGRFHSPKYNELRNDINARIRQLTNTRGHGKRTNNTEVVTFADLYIGALRHARDLLKDEQRRGIMPTHWAHTDDYTYLINAHAELTKRSAMRFDIKPFKTPRPKRKGWTRPDERQDLVQLNQTDGDGIPDFAVVKPNPVYKGE